MVPAFAACVAALVLLVGTNARAQTRQATAVPRFVYLAEPASGPAEQGLKASEEHDLDESIDARGRVLSTDNPVRTGFLTIDTTRLTKRLQPDPAHPGSFTYEGTIRSKAIFARSRVTYDDIRSVGRGSMATQTWNLTFNNVYLRATPKGVYPRVTLSGSPASGEWKFANGVGAPGPKLILVDSAGYVHGLETRPDELTVIVHGTPHQGFALGDGSEPVTIRALAARIRTAIREQGLPENIPIRLDSCEAGEGDMEEHNTSAQRLADALIDAEHPTGNVVIATTGVGINHATTVQNPDGSEDVVVHPIHISPWRHVPYRLAGPILERASLDLPRYQRFVPRPEGASLGVLDHISPALRPRSWHDLSNTSPYYGVHAARLGGAARRAASARTATGRSAFRMGTTGR